MKQPFRYPSLGFTCLHHLAVWSVSVLLLACNLISVTPASTPTRARVTPTLPSPTATRTPRAGAPVWWDARLALPASFDFQGDAQNALWSTRETNVAALRDVLARQAQAAGYQVFIVTQSQDAIYDVLCVRGTETLALNLTLGSDTTVVRAMRAGVLHLKVSGAVNLEHTLPLRARLDVLPGSEWSVGTAVPDSQCSQCEYFVNVLIAPFKGVGHYDSRAGTYVIDVQVIPGGNADENDFRWPLGGCIVTVRENSGTFHCQQLQNVNDQTKRIDVSASWTQP